MQWWHIYLEICRFGSAWSLLYQCVLCTTGLCAPVDWNICNIVYLRSLSFFVGSSASGSSRKDKGKSGSPAGSGSDSDNASLASARRVTLEPSPRNIASMPQDLSGSRQSFKMAMGNPCEFFVDVMWPVLGPFTAIRFLTQVCMIPFSLSSLYFVLISAAIYKHTVNTTGLYKAARDSWKNLWALWYKSCFFVYIRILL